VVNVKYKLGDCMNAFENEMYDYVILSPPCYEDLASFGVSTKNPESYKTEFFDKFVPEMSPSLGTVTVAFTGARRNDGRVLAKYKYVTDSFFEHGYYLRDVKFCKKRDTYDGYSHTMIQIYTFQKNGTKSIYNLRENKAYSEYGLDCWGPFAKELKVAGEIVGQPVEIAERCITNFTNPGHTVFDPFAGIGTALAAARKHNRNSIGYEIRKEIWEFGNDHFKF